MMHCNVHHLVLSLGSAQTLASQLDCTTPLASTPSLFTPCLYTSARASEARALKRSCALSGSAVMRSRTGTSWPSALDLLSGQENGAV